MVGVDVCVTVIVNCLRFEGVSLLTSACNSAATAFAIAAGR